MKNNLEIHKDSLNHIITQRNRVLTSEEKIELSVKKLIEKFEIDGSQFYNEVRVLVKKHHLKGTITDAQLKAIKTTLEPALRPLKLGEWDIAQDNINAINRPNGVLGQLYDFVKNKIDNYLASQV